MGNNQGLTSGMNTPGNKDGVSGKTVNAQGKDKGGYQRSHGGDGATVSKHLAERRGKGQSDAGAQDVSRKQPGTGSTGGGMPPAMRGR